MLERIVGNVLCCERTLKHMRIKIITGKDDTILGALATMAV